MMSPEFRALVSAKSPAVAYLRPHVLVLPAHQRQAVPDGLTVSSKRLSDGLTVLRSIAIASAIRFSRPRFTVAVPLERGLARA